MRFNIRKEKGKLFFLVIVLFLFFTYFFLPKGTSITIQNDTKETISGLSLYSLWGEEEVIDPIQPGEIRSFFYEIGPANENAVILKQQLKNQSAKKYLIIGYVSQIKYDITITIRDIDENKNLILTVIEND